MVFSGFSEMLKSVSRMGLALLVVLSFAACSAQFRNHGYVPSDDELNQIIVGVDTKDTVSDVIGQPGAAGLLDDSGWYYVRSKFRHFEPTAPKEVDRQVVAISFAKNGTVSNVERFGLEDGQVIALSRRVTEENVAGVGFLQQLFGNIGNVSPDQLLQ